MNTIEKAHLYSATLKQRFGVAVPESLDLAVPHMRHLLKRFCT